MDERKSTSMTRAGTGVPRPGLRGLIRLILLALVGVFSGCSFGGPTSVDVETFDLGGVPETMQESGNGFWVIVSAGQPSEDILLPYDLALAYFDADAGEVSSWTKLPVDSSTRQFWVTGDTAYVEHNSILDGLAHRGGDELLDDPLANAILEIDIPSTELVAQYPVEERIGQVWFDGEGFVWYTNVIQLIRMDLETGERVTVSGQTIIEGKMVLAEGHLWMLAGDRATKVDPETAELVSTFEYGVERSQETRVENINLGLWFHDGSYWIHGATEGQPDQMFEYDLETGETSNPVPIDQIPTENLEMQQSRWTCCAGQKPFTDDQVWKRTDLESGEELGEYNFDGFEPFTEHDGYLWLRSDTSLGRVLLDDL